VNIVLQHAKTRREAMGVELYNFQQQLAKMQMQLEKAQENYAHISHIRRQAEEQLQTLQRTHADEEQLTAQERLKVCSCYAVTCCFFLVSYMLSCFALLFSALGSSRLYPALPCPTVGWPGLAAESETDPTCSPHIKPQPPGWYPLISSTVLSARSSTIIQACSAHSDMQIHAIADTYSCLHHVTRLCHMTIH